MKFQFILGVMEQSESSNGQKTGVFCQADLFNIADGKKTGEVAIWELFANDEDTAYAMGCQKAFFANFTAHDTMTAIRPT